jgi:hypothetical protein
LPRLSDLRKRTQKTWKLPISTVLVSAGGLAIFY